MEPTRELLEGIRSERLARARRMTPEERLVSGPQLFAVAVECMRAGVRLEHPEAGEGEIRRLVGERLERMRQKDERAIYGRS